MASAWGNAWGSAWGSAWGTIVAPLPEPGGAGGSPAVGRYAGLSSARDERKRQQIADELKALYREIYETAKPDSDVADRAAAVVAEYAPTKAPDFPPPDAVDWTIIADESRAIIAAIRDQLRAIGRDLARAAAEEDDLEVLMLTAL